MTKADQAKFSVRAIEFAFCALVIAAGCGCFAAWATHPGAGVGYGVGMIGGWIVMVVCLMVAAAIAIVSVTTGVEADGAGEPADIGDRNGE